VLHPVAAPAGAFYLFGPVPVCGTIGLATDLAKNAGVLTIPGVAFGERGEGFLRISYAAEPDAITEGFSRIGEYLKVAGK
jgi:aspartate/methionine/tyrosine aminotransferase